MTKTYCDICREEIKKPEGFYHMLIRYETATFKTNYPAQEICHECYHKIFDKEVEEAEK